MAIKSFIVSQWQAHNPGTGRGYSVLETIMLESLRVRDPGYKIEAMRDGDIAEMAFAAIRPEKSHALQVRDI